MDLNSLFTTQNILQSAAVGIIIFTLRSWFELKWAMLAQNSFWTGVCLPSGALVVSLLISFLLPVVGQSLRDTILNALLDGFISGYIFSIIKATLLKESEK